MLTGGPPEFLACTAGPPRTGLPSCGGGPGRGAGGGSGLWEAAEGKNCTAHSNLLDDSLRLWHVK